MSTPDDLHAPTPAFVAGLEEAVLRAYREADAIPMIPRAPSARWRDWGRIAAVLVLGAALGVGGQFASAQVRDARTRSEIERSILAERELQGFRLDLAKEEVKRIDAAVRVGGMPARALMEAAREQRVSETELQRLDLDLAEVRLTNALPRNELSAPLVGGRDFVLDRLRLRAPLALREEDGATRLAIEADRRVKLGLDPPSAAIDARMRAVDAHREMQLVAMQLRLRAQFLKERLSPAEVTRLQQQEAMQIEVGRTKELFEFDKERLAQAETQRKAGTITEVEFRRVQLEYLERERMLYRMQVELKYMGKKDDL